MNRILESVQPSNAEVLMDVAHVGGALVGGALVGGASLEAAELGDRWVYR